MEENYILAKNTIDSKYLDNKYYPLLVVSLYVLLEKYPDFKYMITGLFKNTNIIIEEDNIIDILKKHRISYLPFEEEDEEEFVTSGLCSCGISVEFIDGDLKVQHNNPIVVCSGFERTDTELLNIFLHEMNHVIKGSINGFYFSKNNGDTYYAYRTGLNTHYCHYDHNTGDLISTEEFVMVDEVINTIQAAELSQNVFSLDGIVEDTRIQEYIDSLNVMEAMEGFGYEEATKVFKPLWKNNCFSQLVEDNIVAGNISNIVNEYESIVGEDSLNNLSIALGIINEADLEQNYDKKYRMAKRYVKNSIKRFSRGKRKVLL